MLKKSKRYRGKRRPQSDAPRLSANRSTSGLSASCPSWVGQKHEMHGRGGLLQEGFEPFLWRLRRAPAGPVRRAFGLQSYALSCTLCFSSPSLRCAGLPLCCGAAGGGPVPADSGVCANPLPLGYSEGNPSPGDVFPVQERSGDWFLQSPVGKLPRYAGQAQGSVEMDTARCRLGRAGGSLLGKRLALNNARRLSPRRTADW